MNAHLHRKEPITRYMCVTRHRCRDQSTSGAFLDSHSIERRCRFRGAVTSVCWLLRSTNVWNRADIVFAFLTFACFSLINFSAVDVVRGFQPNFASWSYKCCVPVSRYSYLVCVQCASNISYNCGQQGHVSVGCTNQTVPKTCFRCNESGHVSRDCPHADAQGPGAGGECYRCGETGHIARMCPMSGGAPAARGSSRSCYNCGGIGHFSRECSSAPGASASAGTKCYNCGNMGHMSRNCPRPPQHSCYTCGAEDHIAAQCPQAAV